MTTISQKEKAIRFRELHHTGDMLLMPNIWDPLGALLMESLNYPAIATASAAIAFANGYQDGEHIPFNDLLLLLSRITKSVTLPVTADIESGYAHTDSQLQENIKRLINSGIVGINFEDSDHQTHQLLPAETQSHKIRLIRAVANEMGVPLFINARSDVYLYEYENNFDHAGSKLKELIKRGLSYKEAGADGFFPILIKQEKEISTLIATIDLPINILTIPGIPDLKTLHKLGVARVTLGPSLLKFAVKAMRSLAMQLKEQEGLSAITGNEITTDFLKNLVGKNN